MPARGLPDRGQLRGQGPVIVHGAAAARRALEALRIDHDIKVCPDAGYALLTRPGVNRAKSLASWRGSPTLGITSRPRTMPAAGSSCSSTRT